MTALIWDHPKDKIYQSGISNTVLFANNVPGVAWNGVISITDDKTNNQIQESHIDGYNYLNTISGSMYRCNISCYDYPEILNNNRELILGGSFTIDVPNQNYSLFGLAYKTNIGNQLEQDDYGYKIHIIYNLILTPGNITNVTITNTKTPVIFNFKGLASPVILDGINHTAHFVFDSTKNNRFVMAYIENLIYGTENQDPYLPDINILIELLTDFDLIAVVDNNDGTWTATGPDEFFDIQGTYFEIYTSQAIMLNETTYRLSDEE